MGGKEGKTVWMTHALPYLSWYKNLTVTQGLNQCFSKATIIAQYRHDSRFRFCITLHNGENWAGIPWEMEV